MVSPSTVLGSAGEHYVMCQLLRRGLIAALAPVGVPNCDIVVTDDIGDRLCAIQVKARMEKGSDGGWHMRSDAATVGWIVIGKIGMRWWSKLTHEHTFAR